MRNSNKIIPILIGKAEEDEILMKLVYVLNRWHKMLEKYRKLEDACLHYDIQIIDEAKDKLGKFAGLKKQIEICRDLAFKEDADIRIFMSQLKNSLSGLKNFLEDGKVKTIRKRYANQGMTERYSHLTKRLARERIRKYDRDFTKAAIDDNKKIHRLVRRIVEKRAAQDVYRHGRSKANKSTGYRQQVRRAVSFNLYKAKTPDYDPRLREWGTHWRVGYKSGSQGKYLISKRSYKSYEDALNASMLYMERNPYDTQKMEPYKCAHCDKWHIGHSGNWHLEPEIQLVG